MSELLIDYGADINQYAWSDRQCTAEFLAREHGHNQLADWFLERMSSKPKERNKTTIAKFLLLYENHTNGINFNLTTDAIVNQLIQWDEKYSISLSDVWQDGLTVSFSTLPNNVDQFAKEVY